MSKHRLRVTLTDQPQLDAAFSVRQVGVRERLIHKNFGAKQQVTVLVPGDQVDSVEIVRPHDNDDLMVLAHAVGVAGKAGGLA